MLSILLQQRDTQWWVSQKQPKHHSKNLPRSITLVTSTTSMLAPAVLSNISSLTTGKPPCPQQTQTSPTAVAKGHLGNTQSFPSCHHTAAPQQFYSQDAGMGRTLCQLHQHHTQKSSCGHTHGVPHWQKGLVTHSTRGGGGQTAGQGWQPFRATTLETACFLEGKEKSFNTPKSFRHLLPLNFFNIWEQGWSQKRGSSLPLQITDGEKNPT